jgi:hypothetical protein
MASGPLFQSQTSLCRTLERLAMSDNKGELLSKLASELEQKFTSNGRISTFFEDCENFYLSIGLNYDDGDKSLSASINVETDGNYDDLEEVEESINDYVFDNGLTSGLISIFGEDGYEDVGIEVNVNIEQI